MSGGEPVARAGVRYRLRVTGIVQGVGFRPFVHRIATAEGLRGFVTNDAAGVVVEVEGDPAAVARFRRRLEEEAPVLASILSVDASPVAVRGESTFEIVASSDADGPRSLVPPDVATCGDCLGEMRDPADRRHRYPFTNCTNCGPRFTIVRDLPYDRPNTTMAGFAMCPACRAEYTDPGDRRYHAQPIACPACGPRLSFHRADGQDVTGTDGVIAAVHDALSAGRVVAVKGIGGYHLACDARSDAALQRLRGRKGRAEKPFAVMVPDIDGARGLVDLDDVETEALVSPARPIVLCRRRPDADVSELVAPGNPWLGVMLPYTPLHDLLFAPVPGRDTIAPTVLVMTSGNRSNEPICHDDADAVTRLADLADDWCTHDRPIELPCDDSVVRVIDRRVVPIRRSRGFAPVPVTLPVDVAPVVAAGGELKNTCCVASGRRAWVGQHVGDMENLETLDAFGASVDAFCRMYGVEAERWAADAHPGYLTRRWVADRHGEHMVEVQHHHAHVASIMAEHGLGAAEPVLAFAFDGTGYGRAADGSHEIWGGEVLYADYDGFERVAHLAPLPLPGGDAAVRHPCRVGVAYLHALGIEAGSDVPAVAACVDVELGVVRRQVERGVGCIPTTSMGRLFDAVASMLGVCHRTTYEAQAALQLEAVATGAGGSAALRFGLEGDVIDPGPVLGAVVEAMRAGLPVGDIAHGFHVAVADLVATVAVECRDERRFTGPVALTGGVFQNALLVPLARERLVREGFDVLTHRVVPPNDGGISLGQAVVAGRRAAAGGS